jgi:alpha-tubulin suppressor-like RCC1 family protein
VAVSGGHTFDRISAGEIHTCGLTDTGEVLCWGNNGNGELGIGQPGGNSMTPIPIDTQLRFDDLEAAFTNSCGLVSGQVWCWGRDYGAGAIVDAIPRRITVGGPYVSLGPGVTASCALADGGAAYCWGAANWTYGQLGVGTLTSSAVPVPVSGNMIFASINSASANNIFTAHVCGLEPTGRAWCWGINRYGELGSSNAADSCPVVGGTPSLGTAFSCSLVPVPVTTSERFAAIDLGQAYSCALSDAGRVWCWGRGSSGALGTGDLVYRPLPTPVGPPTDPPVVTRFDLVLGLPTVAVGDSIAGFQRSLDQNGLWIPGGAPIAVSDTTVARVQFAPDAAQYPAGTFHVHGLSRGSAVLSASFGGVVAQVTVTVN